MAVSDAFLQELRMKTDIESLISSYVDLRRRGRTLNGLCPFHNEKTPSFTVYPESQSFYCFGCGAGGDAITFVRRAENLDYIEAVKFLAQRAGMSMPEEGYDDSLSRQRKRMLEANREAARFFHSQLWQEHGEMGLSYFRQRGLSDATIRHFGLGFAPESWNALERHMTARGFTKEELYLANLLQKSQRTGNYYDTFRNRAMIPIIDLRGNVIAFGGRVLDDSKPKYVNTADTLVYKKSQGVFALNFAKSFVKDGRLILAEGYMDVIALHQAGFENAVACLGTALTEEQARLLSRYAEEIILSYDSDEAGQAAARKAIRIFSHTGVKVRVLKLSGGKDPDEIIKKFGRERFKRLIENAENDIEYRLEKEKERYDILTADGKVDFLKAACSVLATLDEPIKIEIYAAKLADEIGVDKAVVLQQTGRIKKKLYRENNEKRFREIEKDVYGKKDAVNPQRAAHLRCAKAEEGLIALLMFNPNFYGYINKKIKPEEFVTDFNRRVFKAVGVILDRKSTVELSDFSADFLPEEMGRISQMRVSGMNSSNTLAECEDYIAAIFDERRKIQQQNPAQMTAQEMSETFKELAVIKNKGSKYE